jgi:allophanate hydrolase
MTATVPSDISFDLASLRAAYAGGRLLPRELVRLVYARIARHPDNPVWIHLLPLESALARAGMLERDIARMRDYPLFGVPFAIKDNIDVAALPTSAACREFTFIPKTTATVVARLLEAGAILIGKTNLDQFATGLVGVRSPWGAVQNAFNPAYVSGGSSSGSAVSVALGQVSFSLGTDTAGSGRVPAAFNNLVGLKPSRGLLSTTGVLPACRSLDCVSVFALNCADAATVFDVANDFDPADAFARNDRPQTALPGPSFRFGVPDASSIDFCGDTQAKKLFDEATTRLRSLGGTLVPVDLTPFYAVAKLLYEGPWVAERHAAIRAFFDTRPEALLPVIHTIIGKADAFSATDSFEAGYEVARLRRITEAVWRDIDVLAVPSAPTIYTIAALEADPIKLNANLGTYTNFVNLLDLAALALPSGMREDGLPFGITLIAPALTDNALLQLGHRYHQATGLTLGASGTPLPETAPAAAADGGIEVAVVGAHLSGLPLNHQLTSRNAKLLRTCRTAPAYRLYALPDSTPPKPGMLRAAGGTTGGTAIEVEIWQMPESQFGGFVAGIPSPLGIGTLTLEDGSEVKGFVCEAHALGAAHDISAFGGWRNYLASLNNPSGTGQLRT